MTLFDTHTHLNLPPLSEDPATVLSRAHSAGVTRFLVPGCNLPTSLSALSLASSNPSVYAALGAHPSYASELTPQDLTSLSDLLPHPQVVALGEIGLDYFHATLSSDRRNQQALFEKMLSLALSHHLPVIIHARSAELETLRLLQSYSVPKAVFHCFSSPPDILEPILAAGYFVSFTGILTFPSASDLQESVRLTPSDRYFLETDAPYLAPQPVRGVTNEPAYLPHLLPTLSSLRQEPIPKIQKYTTQNALRFFNIPT